MKAVQVMMLILTDEHVGVTSRSGESKTLVSPLRTKHQPRLHIKRLTLYNKTDTM